MNGPLDRMNTMLAETNLRTATGAGVPDGRGFVGLTGGDGPKSMAGRSLTHNQDSCRETGQRPGLNPFGSGLVPCSTHELEVDCL